MAIARVTITCCECGKPFELRKEKRNRTEADAYEAWAKEASLSCPDCYRKGMQQKAAREVAAALESHGITLPEITGVSEKQTSYALSVRARILADNISKLDTYVKFQAHAKKVSSDPEFAKQCEARGMSVAEAYNKSLRLHNLEALHVSLTSATAREILDWNRAD